MNAPTKIQIINGPDGKPAFVVIPYAEYMQTHPTARIEEEDVSVPHEVVALMLEQQMTPVRAWREYLKLTQAEVAARLGISQPSYAKQENSDSLRRSSIEKIAAALGIKVEQLDV